MTAGEPFALDADEADAIAELFNIGMGEPAAALSSMLGEEVHLSVPSFAVSTHARISRDLAPGMVPPVCAVRGAFAGPFTGEAMLIFPEQGTLALVGRLVPVDPAADGPGEMEQDALTEIGNIILNGCLASLSNLIGGEIAGTVPGYGSGDPEAVIGSAEDPVLFVRIDMALAAGDARGHALFLLDIASLDAFREAIRRTMDNL
ncbi:chemotaxis protein [Azospirillum doebereinerae]|uniref:Chemotaxis protein n=1 Tax=Azospirillum doebereinerae TaxID=92933 RepID=A0A3S0XQI1_9PROT|nr:chemotaxis protein [Azospirillum doebereinerae]MCG5239283.1 chemotaxis protein [Azospirillum doebereinerae]RUQ75156.1 chemotaxis protein [Azospirillum doebereinerae]